MWIIIVLAVNCSEIYHQLHKCYISEQHLTGHPIQFTQEPIKSPNLCDGQIFAVHNPHQNRVSNPSTEVLFRRLIYALLVVNLKNLENLIFALITLLTTCDGTRVRLSFFF